MLKKHHCTSFSNLSQGNDPDCTEFHKKNPVTLKFDSFNDCVRHKPYITETVGPVTVLTGVKDTRRLEISAQAHWKNVPVLCQKLTYTCIIWLK